jgi:arylsulfatase A-like enzyme
MHGPTRLATKGASVARCAARPPLSCLVGARSAATVQGPARDTQAQVALHEAATVQGEWSGELPTASDVTLIIVNLDDAGRSQFGQYGDFNRWPSASHPYASMPFVDGKMASRGVRFTNARVAARCAPTRACNLTGRQPHVSSTHLHGTRVGNIPQQGGLTTSYPHTDGVLASMRPWPVVARESGAPHYMLHLGKVHCTAHTINDSGQAIEDEPVDQIVTEIGFDKAYKTELGPQATPTEPWRGYKGFSATRVDTGGATTTLDPGTDYITDWELARIKQELTDLWGADPTRPAVVHWWTNSPHQAMPALDVTAVPGWGNTPRVATLSYLETCPGIASADGRVSYNVVSDNFGGDFVTYGPGYSSSGVASSPFDPTNPAYPYGPNGSLNGVWRRHLAQLEAWDAYIDELDTWLQSNYPERWQRTLWVIHCDNGEQDVAVQPIADNKFSALGSEYSVLPPTVDGTTSTDPGNLYHSPDQAKNTVYDEGILTPLIVFGEPIPAAMRGQDCATLTDATDWYATILDIIAPRWRQEEAAEDLAKVDSVSFAPGLVDATYEGRAYSLHQIYTPSPAPEGAQTRIQRCVIDADGYKLMRAYDVGAGEDEWLLFDLNADPGELNNVYGNPSYAVRQKTLQGVYDALVGEPLTPQDASALLGPGFI